jgi:hypothetical protein
VDLEARNTFHEQVGVGTLKCITGFNHYGGRDDKINSELVRNKCPRYRQEESWEYVILYEGIKELKEKYLEKLSNNIKKIKNIEHLDKPIEWMLQDIEQYLNKDKENEGKTTQSIIGIKNLFRG